MVGLQNLRQRALEKGTRVDQKVNDVGPESGMIARSLEEACAGLL